MPSTPTVRSPFPRVLCHRCGREMSTTDRLGNEPRDHYCPHGRRCVDGRCPDCYTRRTRSLDFLRSPR